jgi:hypothetical protein
MRNNVGIGAHLLGGRKRERSALEGEENSHFFPCDVFSLYKNQYAYIVAATFIYVLKLNCLVNKCNNNNIVVSRWTVSC